MTPSFRNFLPWLLPFGVLASGLRAHSGNDFFLVEGASTIGAGHLETGSTFEATRHSGADSFGVEPYLSYGLTPWLAAGFQASFADEGDGWSFRSVLPVLRFTPKLPLPLGLTYSAGCQVADGAASHGHSTVHVHTAPAPDPGVDLGPDAPPPAPGGTTTVHVHGDHRHGSSVIHLHDQSALFQKLSFGGNLLPHTLVACDLIAVQPEGTQLRWASALGISQRLSPQWSVGAEWLGDLGSNGQQILLGSVSWRRGHHLGLRLGIGGGLTPASPDVTVRTGLSWTF